MRLDGLDAAAVDRAAALVAAGELVAFPTETVYGLGARADSDDAVAKIFALKGRPTGHPLIVHVADRAGAERFATTLPPVATWTISGCPVGRPLSAKILATASSLSARAPSPYTVSVGNATSSPAAISAAA